MTRDDRDADPHVPPPRVLAFTAGQRRAIVLVISIFIVCIAVTLIRNPTHVDDPMPAESPRHGELLDRIDPNTADVATLSALPQLGARRAGDIVAYRERQRGTDPGRIVFTKLDDLLRVSDAGGVMPPKSTWFEPKLRDAVLIHPI